MLAFLNWVVNSLKNNQEIKVVNDQINNPVSVYDCSRTINQLINESTLGKYHLGSDNLCSRFDFAMKIAKFGILIQIWFLKFQQNS